MPCLSCPRDGERLDIKDRDGPDGEDRMGFLLIVTLSYLQVNLHVFYCIQGQFTDEHLKRLSEIEG